MTSVKNDATMQQIGERFGVSLRGGEVVELIGDVGAGKTTLVKGIGRGLKLDEDVQSPSFTISRVYDGREGLALHHYDFYRLTDAGIMSYELAESIGDPHVITIIEWADTVSEVLPDERIVIRIVYTPDGNGRELSFTAPKRYNYLELP